MNLTPLFAPQSIAVIGVSRSNDRHPANVIYNKLHLRYPVKAFAVNPAGGSIGRNPLYPNIGDIPHIIDLAVIAARAEYVPQILKDCIQNSVGGAMIISGGFSEMGRDDLQSQITVMAQEADFPLIGPNCLGIYAPSKFDTFFLPGQRVIHPKAGPVALVSQSGGVLVDQMVKFAGENIGLSLAISIGNKAVINELKLLEYLDKDKSTRVIAFYIEGFRKNEGRLFVQAAKECCKPIIVLKAGKSAQGKRAVSSHTASLAGDYTVFSQVIKQFGIVEAQNEYELLAFCESFACYDLAIDGNVGIITLSGGHGALAMDTCARHGLSAPLLSPKTQKELKSRLSAQVSSIASLGNPIDLTGSAVDDDFIAAASCLSRDSDLDCLLILMLPYSPGISSDLGARLSNVYQETQKPMVAYVPHEEKYKMLTEGFELNNVPVSSSIEGAVHMIEALRRRKRC